jgi:hypothetical protein
MKAKNLILTITLVLVCAGTGLAADTDSNDIRPHIGVMLDGAPLPDLLVKHLRLEPGQGIRIANIHRGSPADKAGFDRDDIIIGFEGGNVDDWQQFVDSVRKAGIGTEVSLEIIHLGSRNTITLKIEGIVGAFAPKYPSEPVIMQSWRPGRFFRLEPGDESWKEMFKDGIPGDVDIKRFFPEVRRYSRSENGKNYTVTIEGNPNDEDSTITVRAGDDEYKTTVNEIDKLPEKYREAAQDAIYDARKWRMKKFDRMPALPSFQEPWDWKDYFEKVHPRNYNPMPHIPLPHGNEMLDRLQEQMRDLRKRLEEQEQRYRERLEKLEKYYDRLSPKHDDKEATESDESTHPEDKDGQRV